MLGGRLRASSLSFVVCAAKTPFVPDALRGDGLLAKISLTIIGAFHAPGRERE